MNFEIEKQEIEDAAFFAEMAELEEEENFEEILTDLGIPREDF